MIDKNGFRFTVQRSNCLQANVYLKKELFTRFECEGKHQFGINLSLLLECLSVFGTSSGNQVALQLNYAGEGHPILLQMVDGDGLLLVCGLRCYCAFAFAASAAELRCASSSIRVCLLRMMSSLPFRTPCSGELWWHLSVGEGFARRLLLGRWQR